MSQMTPAKLEKYMNQLELTEVEKEIMCYDPWNFTIYNYSQQYRGLYLILRDEDTGELFQKIKLCERLGFLVIRITTYNNMSFEIIKYIIDSYLKNIKK